MSGELMCCVVLLQEWRGSRFEMMDQLIAHGATVV